jgi:V-type H+-transporting ATPase subunit a
MSSFSPPSSHSQLNPDLSAFQRKFIAEVRRCDEMERKVMYIRKELIKDGMEVNEIYQDLPSVPNPREFIDLEALFEKTENEILELSENFSQLLQNFQELTELQYVLQRTQVSNFYRSIKFLRVTLFFNSYSQSFFNDQAASANMEGTKMDEATDGQQQQLGFVAGVIERERILGFERMLWRISRGNVFLRQADIEKPFTDVKTVRRWENGNFFRKLNSVLFI